MEDSIDQVPLFFLFSFTLFCFFSFLFVFLIEYLLLTWLQVYAHDVNPGKDYKGKPLIIESLTYGNEGRFSNDSFCRAGGLESVNVAGMHFLCVLLRLYSLSILLHFVPF